MNDHESILRSGLRAIEEIKGYVAQLAVDKSDGAKSAMESLMCRIEDLFMDCENIRDDESED